jgi:hypothetical protein
MHRCPKIYKFILAILYKNAIQQNSAKIPFFKGGGHTYLECIGPGGGCVLECRLGCGGASVRCSLDLLYKNAIQQNSAKIHFFLRRRTYLP